MMDKPLLSICIPTFNRSEQLERSLQSIVKQAPFKERRVEVVICDNASTDDTQEVIEKYKNTYSNIITHKFEQYMDNRRFPFMISLGTGLLRKLSNDTIEYEDGALEDMCSIIESLETTRPVVLWSNGKLNGVPNKIIDFDTFVKNATFQVTWIGAFSIWDIDCDNIEKDTAGCEKLLWQVRKTYELARAKDKCVIIDNKFGKILSVDRKDISYGLYHVFLENHLSMLKPYLENGSISKKSFHKVEKDILYDIFTPWIIEYELNKSNYKFSENENLKSLVFTYYRKKPYWLSYFIYYNLRKCSRFFKLLMGIGAN